MALTSRLSGGKKLKEALRLIGAKAKNGALLSVGFPEGGTYPDGTSVPLVAALNEFGHRAPDGTEVPPRPFFRSMIAEESPNWGEYTGALLKENDYDAVKTMEAMGEEIEGSLRESISTLLEPALADSTVAAKSRGKVSEGLSAGFGPSKPLIKTGHMLNSVDSFVEET